VVARIGRGLWILALALAAQVGCATVPVCPAKGGPAWRELTSAHFVMRTDLPEADALNVLRRLEDARASMLAMMWPRAPESPDRIEAYAFASHDELNAYLGPHYLAVHVHSLPFPPIVMIAGVDPRSQRDANHELAHALSLELLPLQPPWFEEGLAEYLSTIHRERTPDGPAIAGEALVARYQFVQRYGISSVATLLGPVPSDTFEMWRFYATSWLLVHYLFNNRFPALERFQDRLAALEPGPKAFRAEFPDLAAGKLESVLKEYAFSGKYRAWTRPIPAWDGKHETRVMTDADVHASRAVLTVLTGQGHDERLPAARADLEEALRDPRPPIDAFVLAFHEPRVAPPLSRQELARRAVAAHPEDWLSWLLVAKAAPGGSAERQEAVRRALALHPQASEALALQAYELDLAKRWSEMLRITNEILYDGSIRHVFWIMHLSALLHTGHCHEADVWGTALEGFLDAKEAAEVAAVRARITCGPPAGARTGRSQAAQAHAGERLQPEAVRAQPAVR